MTVWLLVYKVLLQYLSTSIEKHQLVRIRICLISKQKWIHWYKSVNFAWGSCSLVDWVVLRLLYFLLVCVILGIFFSPVLLGTLFHFVSCSKLYELDDLLLKIWSWWVLSKLINFSEPFDNLTYQQLGYFPVALPALLIPVAWFQLSSWLNLYLTWFLGVILTVFLFDVVMQYVSWW